MNDWIEICRIDDIPVLGARRVRQFIPLVPV